MYDWFEKRRADDSREERRYDRRQFLRGSFLRDVLDEADGGQAGASSGSQPREGGIARIERNLCLAYNRSFCTVCAERCPTKGAVELARGKPRIVPAHCTGCGICREVCPAPLNAITLADDDDGGRIEGPR